MTAQHVRLVPTALPSQTGKFIYVTILLRWVWLIMYHKCFNKKERAISVRTLLDTSNEKNQPLDRTLYASASSPLMDCKFSGDHDGGKCLPNVPKGFVFLSIQRHMKAQQQGTEL
eukprot:11259810-Ditylum_brightwellii.AAC.1